MVHGASLPSKIMPDRNLAKLMSCIMFSFVIFYIAFKTRIIFKKQMERGAHLLAPGPEDVKGGFVRKFMLLMVGISAGGQSTQDRECSPL